MNTLPAINEAAFKQSLKTKSPDRLYLLYGTEGYMKSYYAELLRKKCINDSLLDFNYHLFEGKDVTLPEVYDCINAFPVMDDYTLTVVRDMPLQSFVKQKGDVESESESDSESGNFEMLTEIISDVPESSILLFFMDSLEVDAKNGKWLKIIKTFEKYGSVLCVDKRSDGDLAKLLSTSAAKKGCTLDRGNASYIVSLAGDDMGTLRNELDKLCAFRAGGVITRADIDASVIMTAEAKIFSLARLIAAGSADEAYSTLSGLLRQREEPIVILAVLINAYTDMYRVRAALDAGAPLSEISEVFKGYKKKFFLLENARRDCRKYSAVQLRHSLEILSDADTRIKSTGSDSTVVLEELLLRLMRI